MLFVRFLLILCYSHGITTPKENRDLFFNVGAPFGNRTIVLISNQADVNHLPFNYQQLVQDGQAALMDLSQIDGKDLRPIVNTTPGYL